MSTVCYKNDSMRDDRIGQTVVLGLGYAGSIQTEAILGEPDDTIQVLCRKDRFPAVMVKYGDEYHPMLSENSIIVACGLTEAANVAMWDDGRFYFSNGYPNVSFESFGYRFAFRPFEANEGQFYCHMATPEGDVWTAVYDD